MITVPGAEKFAGMADNTMAMLAVWAAGIVTEDLAVTLGPTGGVPNGVPVAVPVLVIEPLVTSVVVVVYVAVQITEEAEKGAGAREPLGQLTAERFGIGSETRNWLKGMGPVLVTVYM